MLARFVACVSVEIIFEFIAEIVVQLVVEVVFDLGIRGLTAFMQTDVGRWVATLVVAIGLGLGAGVVWGRHVAGLGQTTTPRSVWVSLVIAGVAVIGAAIAWRDEDWDVKMATVPELVRMTPLRFGMFGVLNAAGAIGIMVGFGK